MFKEAVDFIRSVYGSGDFIALHQPYFDNRELELTSECIKSTFVSSVGKFVSDFEDKVAEFCGVKRAVACVNGTNALHLGLKLAGVAEGDKVVTQPLTFIATSNAIKYCNAEPVFVDVDRDTMGMSPEKLEDFLKKMTSAGKKLLVATSKPQVFAEKILEHFHLAQYFTFIGGSNLDGTRAHKDEVIAYVLAENHITQLDQVVMVGDRKYDLAGAQKLGLDCIGVLYGYGSRQEMETAGATALAENLEELTGLLLGSR